MGGKDVGVRMKTLPDEFNDSSEREASSSLSSMSVDRKLESSNDTLCLILFDMAGLLGWIVAVNGWNDTE